MLITSLDEISLDVSNECCAVSTTPESCLVPHLTAQFWCCRASARRPRSSQRPPSPRRSEVPTAPLRRHRQATAAVLSAVIRGDGRRRLWRLQAVSCPLASFVGRAVAAHVGALPASCLLCPLGLRLCQVSPPDVSQKGFGCVMTGRLVKYGTRLAPSRLHLKTREAVHHSLTHPLHVLVFIVEELHDDEMNTCMPLA